MLIARNALLHTHCFHGKSCLGPSVKGSPPTSTPEGAVASYMLCGLVSQPALLFRLHHARGVQLPPYSPHCMSRPRCMHVLATVSGQPQPRDRENGEDGMSQSQEDDEFLDELDASFQEIRDAADGRPRRIRARGGLRARSSGRPGTRRPLVDGEIEDSDANLRFRSARRLLEELGESYDSISERPSQQLLLGTLALLLGFFVAQGQALGGGDQGGRWEYVSAGAATFVVERISRSHWRRDPRERSPTLKLLNAFNVGFVYGCILDALKFAG